MNLAQYALSRHDVFEVSRDRGNIECYAPALTSRYVVFRLTSEGFLTEYSSVYLSSAGRGAFEMLTEFVVEQSTRVTFMLVEGI